MIRYLRNDEIARDRWDEAIRGAVNTSICAYSWYLDLTAGTWDALVEGDYTTVMPLTWKKKAGLKYICQPPFTQQLGIFGSGLITTKKTREFLEAIPAEFRLIDMNLNKHARIEKGPDVIRENTNYELEMIRPYDSIRGAYSQNTERSLRKALKNDLQVHRNLSPEPVIKLFRENRGRQLRTLGEQEYSILMQLAYRLVHNGVGQVMGVYDDRNNLCAGMIVAETRQRSIFLFSALSKEGRSLNAMPFLIDDYLRSIAGSERIFDFEGSNDPGLARFYSGFGSRASSYQSVRVNRLPALLRPAFLLYRLLRP